MEDFLDEASAGNQSEIILYRIHTDGTVSREKFTFDGKDMYSLYTKGRWTDDMESAFSVQQSFPDKSVGNIRRKDGSFSNYCTAQPPELTEGRGCIRDDTGKAAEGRVQGDGGETILILSDIRENNLLCSEWSEDQIERLDF